eukprot:CAMPEP_0178411504 /NCGR_PEP_ID=MMETSP0689_2-20121128/21527_1 /TAXON_ID=160604 /ORGANISM="Amphidinium massartii, Strain CS-259" /LENGTH=619 /DNA_ID=CAMNT_0020032709 /DNA_START=16 /DNA_END=1875 /DNA_ORIENTATION=+
MAVAVQPETVGNTEAPAEAVKFDRSGSGYVMEHRFAISWKDLSYTVKTKKGDKTILSGASGVILPGQLVALMGPSGSGKTTLLDLLADRIQTGKIEGQILAGNKPRDSESFRKICSYVMSEDALFSAFTVKETLRYTTRFVLANMSSADREKRVKAVLETMGLESCADSRVGDPIIKGISAGQKRRLSIAIELLGRAPLLLLDEPTSGLDAVAAYQVVKLLKQIAAKQHTVALSIHQPSTTTFNVFDTVGILAKGRQIYLGPVEEALDYFESVGHKCPAYANPADFYIEVVNTDFNSMTNDDLFALADKYAVSDTAKKHLAQVVETEDAQAYAKQVSNAGLCGQFITLLIRMLHMAWKNPYIWAVRIVMYICLTVMVGTMYEGVGNDAVCDGDEASGCVCNEARRRAANSLLPCLFYVAAFLVFMSVAVLPFFLEIRDVFRRERSNGQIWCLPYVIADFFANLPGIAVIALTSSVLVVFISGMNNFGGFFLNLLLSLITAESLMRFIGAGQPHYILGMAFGAGLFGMFMLCEGFMVRPQDIPDYWIWAHKIAFHTYTFEWFMHNQFSGDAGKPCGEGILQEYGMDEVDPLVDALVLLGFAVLFQAGFFVMLYVLHTGRR